MIDDKIKQYYEDKAKQMTEEYLRNGVESNNHLKFVPVFAEDEKGNVAVTYQIVSESEVELYEIDMEDEPELLARIKEELESEEVDKE